MATPQERALDLGRTFAALVDAQVRSDEQPTELYTREGDLHWTRDLVIASANVAICMAARIGDASNALMFFAQVQLCRSISDDDLADDEIQQWLRNGIHFGIEYAAELAVKSWGADKASEKTRELIDKLAVLG